MASTKRAIWKTVFIEVLELTGNVVLACKRANVARSVAYAARSKSKTFAVEWDEAIEVAVAGLEEEARRRAVEGVEDPVFYQGSISGHVTRYSDSLLMFLLKAHKPEKYAERRQHTGPGGGPIAFTGALATYELGADESGTIFDELARAGAFQSTAADAKADGLHPVSSDGEAGGVPSAAA